MSILESLLWYVWVGIAIIFGLALGVLFGGFLLMFIFSFIFSFFHKETWSDIGGNARNSLRNLTDKQWYKESCIKFLKAFWVPLLAGVLWLIGLRSLSTLVLSTESFSQQLFIFAFGLALFGMPFVYIWPFVKTAYEKWTNKTLSDRLDNAQTASSPTDNQIVKDPTSHKSR